MSDWLLLSSPPQAAMTKALRADIIAIVFTYQILTIEKVPAL
jgi:hypothetical protein